MIAFPGLWEVSDFKKLTPSAFAIASLIQKWLGGPCESDFRSYESPCESDFRSYEIIPRLLEFQKNPMLENEKVAKTGLTGFKSDSLPIFILIKTAQV